MQAGFNASVRWAAAREGRWADGDEQASRGVRLLHRGRTLFGQRVSRQIDANVHGRSVVIAFINKKTPKEGS